MVKYVDMTLAVCENKDFGVNICLDSIIMTNPSIQNALSTDNPSMSRHVIVKIEYQTILFTDTKIKAVYLYVHR